MYVASETNNKRIELKYVDFFSTNQMRHLCRSVCGGTSLEGECNLKYISKPAQRVGLPKIICKFINTDLEVNSTKIWNMVDIFNYRFGISRYLNVKVAFDKNKNVKTQISRSLIKRNYDDV